MHLLLSVMCACMVWFSMFWISKFAPHTLSRKQGLWYLWVINTHNITTCGTTIFLFRFCCSGIRIWLRICACYIGRHKYGLCVCTYRRNCLSTSVNLLLSVDHLPVKVLCRLGGEKDHSPMKQVNIPSRVPWQTYSKTNKKLMMRKC